MVVRQKRASAGEEGERLRKDGYEVTQKNQDNAIYISRLLGQQVL